MHAASLKPLLAAAFALALSACNTTSILKPGEAAYVEKIDVSLAPSVGNQKFADHFLSSTRAEASRFPRVGAAKHVRVAVTELHYKNAAKSLLIGDANFAKAKVTMIDAATGRVQGEGDATALDQVAINGVIGAIISAAQDKEKVDKRLADGLARDVMTTVYGATAAAEARKRPFGAPAEPASPGVAPKPAAPAEEVPVAAAGKRRTAMAAQPAGAPAAR